MHHRLRRDFFDRPDVRDVIGPEELVGGAFAPTKKTPFVIAEKQLARQDWVLLHPNKLLRVVQSRLLECLGEVADIGVSSPDKKQAPGLERPSDVSEPGAHKLVE